MDDLQDVGVGVGVDLNAQTRVEVADMVMVTLECALQTAVAAGVLSQEEKDTVTQSAYLFAHRKLLGGPDVFSLTLEEIAAIHSYTQESQLYVQLNARLRNFGRDCTLHSRTLLAPLLRYLKLLLTALYKLKLSPSTTVWRGIKLPLETLGGCAEGTPVIWWGLSSTTANMGVLTDDQFLGNTGQRTLFALVTSSVVNIQPYSAVGGEEEFVAFPGTVYETVGVLGQPDLDIVHLRDSTSPPLIDFLHPQIAARLNLSRWSSISDAVSRPNPRKTEPRCFLLHARSGCILENHKHCRWRLGHSLQLHEFPDMQDGRAADHDVNLLSQGCFCWKLEVHAKGLDGLPIQACIRSDVFPQKCIAGDSDRQSRFRFYPRRRHNLEPQWIPQFLDNQTVTFKSQMNGLYLAAVERDGAWTISLSDAPDAWVLLPAAGAFTPRAAVAMVAAIAMFGGAAGALVCGGAAGAAAAVGAVALKTECVTMAASQATAAVALSVGAGAVMHGAVSPMDHNLWVDKTRQ